MKRPQNLLVVITREKPDQPALERALLFGEHGPICITLFSALYNPALELTALLAPNERKILRQQALNARENYLNQLKERFQNQQITINTHVVWHKKTAQAVVEYTHDHEIDITVKRISSDANSENPFIMPTDWHLLRFCNSALLLVKDQEWKRSKPILAAVCPTSDIEEHQKLNHSILDYSHYLAELLGSKPHVINCFVSPVLDAPLELAIISNEKLKQKVAQHHTEKLNELIEQHPYSSQQSHVVEGLPEIKIPQLAEELGAQLVVMGTVGRTGLTAAFMGNTAERVLSRLKCEVLALKPEDFES
jgi:universal stress protein E